MGPSPERGTVLVVSAGDPGGIGGEILHKALARLAPGRCVLLALPRTRALAWLGHHGAESRDMPRVTDHGLPAGPGFWCLEDEPGWPDLPPGCPASPTAEGGRFAWHSLERAVDLVLADPRHRALVTAPIHKQAMALAGFRWPGHTEYLEERGDRGVGLMLMHSRAITVGLATNHLPLAAVADALDDRVLEHRIRLCRSFLDRQGITEDLCILGLDPHCGDGGAIGHTDSRRIAPLVQRLRGQGLALRGPVPADAALARGQGRFLAMYHDQGLPVFKLVAGGEGVNITLGTGFVRVSPDHGTAFDIAGGTWPTPPACSVPWRPPPPCWETRTGSTNEETRTDAEPAGHPGAADPYTVLAGFYDRLMDHVNYEAWADLLERLCHRWAPRPPLSHFDAACGTGRLLEQVDGVGMEYLGGMDRSAAMLERARQRLRERRPAIELFTGDLLKDGPARPVDLLSCLYDSINYLETPERLARGLANLGSRLAPGGRLVFDICTRANSVRHFDGRRDEGHAGEYSWIRETEFDRERSIHQNRFIIIHRGGAVREEVHRQRIYSIGQIRAACATAGLEVLGCHGEFSLEPGSEDHDRVHFVARRAGEAERGSVDE
jgi:4-hydroxy-L-threonine phosphate dehydrogenase PdxA/SAM-dependent methyltransferase